MFEKIKREQPDEQIKKSLIQNLDIVYNFFSSEKLVYCEDLLNNLERLIEKTEEIKPEKIAPNSHAVDVIKQIEMKLRYVQRLKNIPEKKEKEVDKKRVSEYRGIVLQVKETLKNYISLCLDNEDFFYGELSGQFGYWGEKTLDSEKNRKKISELNVDEFVQISREHFEQKMEKEAA